MTCTSTPQLGSQGRTEKKGEVVPIQDVSCSEGVYVYEVRCVGSRVIREMFVDGTSVVPLKHTEG